MWLYENIASVLVLFCNISQSLPITKVHVNQPNPSKNKQYETRQFAYDGWDLRIP